MSEPLSASERFLQQLADGLEALGPTETSEVLAEVQSHLADAIAEAGGNESEALAHFGSPDLLAMRILEERGILRGGPAVPEARGSRRLAALVIDVALWLLLLWLFSIPVVGIAVFGSVPLAGVVLGWAVLAALVAATVWWWVKKRRERGYVTPGMHVMGLRRIRVGQTTRMVRERDIPGLARRNGARVAAVLGVLLAVLILASMSYSIFSSRAADRQAEVQTAVWDSATGVAIVSQLYRDVMTGAQAGDLEGLFAPAAIDEASSLVARRSQGLIDSYSINSVDLLVHTPQDEWDDDETYETVVRVGVNEYARGSDEPEQFDYRVGLNMEPQGEGGWAGDWLIEAVEPVEE